MLALNEIGGGYVRRRFDLGHRKVGPGDELTGDEIRAIPATNRAALLNQRYIEVYPARVGKVADDAAALHIVNLGFGKFNVVSGVKLNAEPLTKEQAETLVAKGVN